MIVFYVSQSAGGGKITFFTRALKIYRKKWARADSSDEESEDAKGDEGLHSLGLHVLVFVL